MLAVLPPAALAALALWLHAARPGWGAARAALRAAILAAVYMVALTEGLSPAGLLRPAPLALGWALALLAGLAGWLRAGGHLSPGRPGKSTTRPSDPHPLPLPLLADRSGSHGALQGEGRNLQRGGGSSAPPTARIHPAPPPASLDRRADPSKPGDPVAWPRGAREGLGVGVGRRKWVLQESLRWRAHLPAPWGERALLAGAALALALTALTAWLAPPATWDSLNYHMPRVAHWAQQGSLRPFATGIEVQNSRTPAAEYAVLNLYVLAGGDRPANLVAWGAALGCALGAAVITRRLGGAGPAPLLAFIVTLSLPALIVQASSTMTDIVAGFWVVCAVLEALDLRRGQGGAGPVLFAGLAAGLALLTKPIALAYLAPFALWAAPALLRRFGPGRALAAAAGALALVVLLHAPFLARNLSLYGTPADPVQSALHLNRSADPRIWLSNLLRHLAIQAGTPSPHVNRGIYLTVAQIHAWLGLDPSDERTTSAGRFRVSAPSLHEDLTTNPVHSYLFAACALWLVVRRRVAPPALPGYALAAAGTLVALSIVFKWQIFGSRYQVPFFVLFAPVAGIALAQALPRRGAALAAGLLLVTAVPWLVGVRTRPLLYPGPDPRAGRLIETPRQDLYYATGPYLQEAYRAMGEMIRATDCERVGLRLPGNSAEYLLWVELGAPRPDLRVEWLVAGTPSARFADPEFEPCAVICEECEPGMTSLRGLGLIYGTPDSPFRLYLGPDRSGEAAPSG